MPVEFTKAPYWLHVDWRVLFSRSLLILRDAILEDDDGKQWQLLVVKVKSSWSDLVKISWRS